MIAREDPDRSFFSESQPDWRKLKPKMGAQLIDKEALIGKMDCVRFVYEYHKGGWPRAGLGCVRKFQSAPADSRRRVSLDYLLECAIYGSRGDCP